MLVQILEWEEFDVFRFTLSRLRDAFSSQFVTNEILSEYLPLREGEHPGSELVNDATRFWFSNRCEGDVPDWSCFKPEQHPTWLPNIILYERNADKRIVTRLVGDTVVDHLPVNPTGLYLEDVLPKERLQDVVMRLERTLSDRLPNYVEKGKVWRHSGLSFDYNALSMPFGSVDTGVERILCILEFNSARLDT